VHLRCISYLTSPRAESTLCTNLGRVYQFPLQRPASLSKRNEFMRAFSLYSLVVALGAATSAVFVEQPKVTLKDVTHGREEPAFIVDVVANGVPEDGKLYKLSADTSSDSVGLDFWIGAKTAYENLIGQNSPGQAPFALKGLSDEDTDASAQTLATRIQTDPRTLAVIGHGITKTTQVGAKETLNKVSPFHRNIE
jgi:hypothetical protein